MNTVQSYSEKQKIRIYKQVDGSIDQISAALAKNRALYRSLTPEQRANSKVEGELLKVINQQAIVAISCELLSFCNFDVLNIVTISLLMKLREL